MPHRSPTCGRPLLTLVSPASTFEAVRGAPGVLAVFTGNDVAGELGEVPHLFAMFHEGMRRPFVATDVVRHVGQPVAAIVAETRDQGADAAELVVVDYELLTPVVDPQQAARDDVLVFPDVGTNVIFRSATKTEANFDECEIVVDLSINNQRLTAAPIEPRSGAAYWRDDGRLVHYSACQGAHPTKAVLTELCGVGGDEHRLYRRLPGGGPPRGHRCHRAGYRPARVRDRHGSGRRSL